MLINDASRYSVILYGLKAKDFKNISSLYKNLKYRYDYGDNWEHIIKIEDVIFDYNKNYSYCLDGSGDGPPEDVGGEGGYEEFVEIMENPMHEEYEYMKQWADGQDYKRFDIDMVNRELENLW